MSGCAPKNAQQETKKWPRNGQSECCKWGFKRWGFKPIWGYLRKKAVFLRFLDLPGALGTLWKRARKADFGPFPGRAARHPSSPHLLHPHLRQPKKRPDTANSEHYLAFFCFFSDPDLGRGAFCLRIRSGKTDPIQFKGVYKQALFAYKNGRFCKQFSPLRYRTFIRQIVFKKSLSETPLNRTGSVFALSMRKCFRVSRIQDFGALCQAPQDCNTRPCWGTLVFKSV